MVRGFPPLRGLLPLLAVLVGWQVAGPAASPYFPRPSTWIMAVAGLWTDGSLPTALLQTLTTFFLGLGLATVVGTAVGVAVGASRYADRALDSTLAFARAVPPATLVPIAALLLGYEETVKLAVVTFAATWSVLLNARAGTRGLDPVLLDTARSLHLGTVDTVRKCVLPALLPAIFVGVRVATPVAVAITLLVEVLTRINGVGALVAAAQRNYLSAQVYGLLLVATLFSLLVTGSVSRIESSPCGTTRGVHDHQETLVPELRAYHHVSLSVTDLGRSTEWYEQVLGLRTVAEIEGAGFRRNRLRAGDDGFTLTLTCHDGDASGAFDERRPGLDHVAFQVEPADIAPLRQRFEQLGVDHSEVKESSAGTAMITLRDPDNVQLEVFGGPFDPAIAAGRPDA